MATVSYKLSIIPSPSNFVEMVEVYASIGGGADTVLATAQPSSTTSVTVDFPVDAVVDWYVRVIGDNGTQADSNHRIFTAYNREQVLPATADSELFVKYNP